MTKAATSGTHVFMLHPNGKLRRLNKDNGRVEAEWQIAKDGKAPVDVDAHDQNLVVADKNAAEELALSLTEEGEDFAKLARQHSIDDQHIEGFCGRRDPHPIAQVLDGGNDLVHLGQGRCVLVDLPVAADPRRDQPAILVGLGIDFAIHYLARYLENRHQGPAPPYRPSP